MKSGQKKTDAHSCLRNIGCALFISLIVTVPLLPSSRFESDDFILLNIIEGKNVRPYHPYLGPLDLYKLLDGNAEHIKSMMNTGPLPWFAHPELKVAFFRPLTSALYVLDHAIFGLSPVGYRLHSLLWYFFLIAVLCLLLNRLLAGLPAALALIAFACAASHQEAVCWIAARYALITATFGFLSLYFHIKWREEKWITGLFLSVFGFALSLLAGEAALGIFPFLFFYELVGGPGAPMQRLKAILPASAVALSWLLVYRALDYGADGSGIYINPLGDPLGYLLALPERLFFIMKSLFYSFHELFPRPARVVLGLVTILLFCAVMPRVWLKASRNKRRTILWLLLGSLFSFLPQTAGTLGPRVLLLPSVGASVAVALMLDFWWRELREARVVSSKLIGIGCLLLALIHFAVAPCMWFVNHGQYKRWTRVREQVIRQAEYGDQGLARQKLVLITIPEFDTGVYYYYQRLLFEHPLPIAWWVLSLAECDQKILRTAADTLVLECINGRMTETPWEIYFRSRDFPFEAGDVVELSGFRATVLAVDDQGPTRIEFKFDRPVDDVSLRFMAWLDGRLRHIQPPPVGESLLLPWRPLPADV